MKSAQQLKEIKIECFSVILDRIIILQDFKELLQTYVFITKSN